MNKKIKCLFIAGLFLTVIFSTCLSVEAVKLTNEKTTTENENNMGSIEVFCYGTVGTPQKWPVSGITVILENNNQFVKIGITGVFGIVKFNGLEESDRYTVTLSDPSLGGHTKPIPVEWNTFNSIDVDKVPFPRNKVRPISPLLLNLLQLSTLKNNQSIFFFSF